MTPLMPLGPKMVNIGIPLFIFGTPMKNGIFSISTGGCRIPGTSTVVLQGPPRRSRKLKIMIWVFPKNRGAPKWMVYNGKSIKMDDLGVPLFSETPIWVVVSFFFSIFIPNRGEMIPFDQHIFQMGWFNHHLDIIITSSNVFFLSCKDISGFQKEAFNGFIRCCDLAVTNTMVKPPTLQADFLSYEKNFLWFLK